uniref:Putative conserved secreted protein n=1 Tax=Phlebotomus kandelakii TaxID=1109342 RepID=A0A6B2E887_9DIPT
MVLKITDISQHIALSVVILLSLTIRRSQAEQCGQEELARCSRPLQVLSSTSDLTIATNKEELNEICPDLYGGLHCIRSYTRRCMSLQHRNHFNKLYHGTNQVIRDLCREGHYQNDYLRHAPCLRMVKPDYEICAKKYQDTISRISLLEQRGIGNATDDTVAIVCCSFREYLDCSERTARRMCGEETAAFTRRFLDKMADSLIREHCEDYSVTSGWCSYELSASSRNSLSVALVATLATFHWMNAR